MGALSVHISPEAMEGGPIAFVKDGDLIHIDIPGKSPEGRSVGCGEFEARKSSLAVSSGTGHPWLSEPLRQVGLFRRQRCRT